MSQLPSLSCTAQSSSTSPIHIGPAAGLSDQAILLSACQLEGGWQVVFIENKAQAFTEIKTIDTLSLLLLILVIGVALFTSRMLARLIIKRLDQLGEEVIQAAQNTPPLALDNLAAQDEFGRLGQMVSIALNSQTLINQLLQRSYEQTQVEAFIRDALHILDNAAWTKHINRLEMYVSLKEDPDLFYTAVLNDSKLHIAERDYETLPGAIRECMARNILITPMNPEESKSYVFPIYLNNTS